MTTVLSTNPATGETRPLAVEESTPAEVRAACLRAAGAARDLATRPLTFRASLLLAVAEELEADAGRIVALADEETALGRPRLEGELRRAAFQLRFFAGVVREGTFLDASIDHPTESPMGPLPDLRRLNVPLGPVAVFGSSNFPLAFSVPGGDTASALAAGCPVVIKAHPAHPATSLATFAAIERGTRRTGAPAGTAALVFGIEAGEALVDDPAITAVGFTGSSAAGTALWRRANARPTPIPFYGELGSANPLVVTPAAARERGAGIGAGIAGSMTLGAGQFCTKPGLLFVPRGADGDRLVTALREALEATGELTMLTTGIADHFRRGREDVAAVPGVATTVAAGATAGCGIRASLFETTSETFRHPASAALREECFGPLAIVVRYQDRDELAAALAVTVPALVFSLFVGKGDPEGAWLLATGQSRAGRVVVNAYPTGVGVTWSQQHGGPWPSTTAPSATSVGAAAIARWLRPVAFQGVPDDLLPPALRDDNPDGVPQRVDGAWRRSGRYTFPLHLERSPS